MQRAEDYLTGWKILDGHVLEYSLRPRQCRLRCIFVSFLGDDWKSNEQRENEENWDAKEVEIQLRNVSGLKLDFDFQGPAKEPSGPYLGNLYHIDASGPLNKAKFLLKSDFGSIEVDQCDLNIAVIRPKALV